MTPDARIFHELWQSAERELAERHSARTIIVDLVAAIIQDKARYDSATNTWDSQDAAENIVAVFRNAAFDEVERMRKALRDILKEVGTSTRANKIANAALNEV